MQAGFMGINKMIEIKIKTKRLNIAPLTAGDYENITEMFSDIENNRFATGVSAKLNEEEVKKRLLFSDNIKTGFNLAATVEGTNGFAGFLRGCVLDGGRVWLYVFMITPELRRKGYGTEFISAVLCSLRENFGAKHVYLSVTSDNKEGFSFWKHLGFNVQTVLTQRGVLGKTVSNINIFVKNY